MAINSFINFPSTKENGTRCTFYRDQSVIHVYMRCIDMLQAFFFLKSGVIERLLADQSVIHVHTCDVSIDMYPRTSDMSLSQLQ
jgi:hypothetical protein